MKTKRAFTGLFALLVLLSSILAGCSESPAKETDKPAEAAEVLPVNPGETEAEVEEAVRDDLGEYDFEDAAFGMMTFENQNFHYRMRADEYTGVQLNDAVFDATLAVEERFRVALEELYYADFSNTPRVNVAAGDTSMDVVRIRCTDATGWWTASNSSSTFWIPAR